MVLIILGLVCKLISKNTPPKHTTHNKSVNNRKKFLCMDKIEQKKKIMERFNKNIEYTKMCLRYCKLNNIESYRISVGLIPNYEDWNWCNDETVIKKLLELKEYDINFTFHADHYVKLGSLKDEVNKKAIFTYKHYYLPLAKLLNIHSICFHMAGYTDGKQKYFNKLLQTFTNFTQDELNYLGLENCERYSADEILNFCVTNDINFILDLHHARCEAKTNDLDWEHLTEFSKLTWKNKAPLFHISSGEIDDFDNKHYKKIREKDFVMWKKYLKDCYVDVETGKNGKETAIKEIFDKI